MNRKCTKCKEYLPLNMFTKERHKDKTYIKSHCKRCISITTVRSAMKQKTGHIISFDNVKILMDMMPDKCEICNKKCSTKNRLAIDHDHNTGEIRGFLCMKCNSALGKFNDDIKMLAKAIQYLNKKPIMQMTKENEDD